MVSPTIAIPSVSDRRAIVRRNRQWCPDPEAPATPHILPSPFTQNGKLTHDQYGAPVSTTMAPMESCDPSCALYAANEEGKAPPCYGKTGPMSWIWRRLSGEEPLTPVQIAIEEANAIRYRLPDWTPLRVHQVGECKTNEAAQIVSGACDARSGPAWGYTHPFRLVDHASWGNVSIFASCETEQDARDATERGYPVAYIVPNDEPLPTEVAGMKTFHCPEQRGLKRSCVECGLCVFKKNSDRMVGKTVLLLRTHGAGAANANEAIRAARAAAVQQILAERMN